MKKTKEFILKIITSFYKIKYLNISNLKIKKTTKLFKFNLKVKDRTNQIIFEGNTKLINTTIIIKGKDNIVKFDSGSNIYNSLLIIKGNNNQIYIGENNRLNELHVVQEGDNNNLTSGRNVTSSGNVEMYIKEGTKVGLGNELMLSRDIIIRTSDAHSILNADNERINFGESIKILDNVWIGQRVMIMKGTNISSGSIVAAGAIVTKSFDEPRVVIAGVPAKIVKRNIRWDRKLL